MKFVGIVVVAVLMYIAAVGLSSLIFSGALGEFAAQAHLPRFSWWQSFCFLICVGIIGGAFGYAGSMARRSD